jgi:DNA-binding MarR family transcriptional regulator
VQLLAAARGVLRRMAPAVHPDLDAEGLRLLVTVARFCERSGRGVRGTELVEVLGVHKSSVSRGVSHLEELGLLARAPDDRDARAHLLTLTERGQAGLEEGRRRRSDEIATALAGWTPEEVEAAAAVLHRLNTDLA